MTANFDVKFPHCERKEMKDSGYVQTEYVFDNAGNGLYQVYSRAKRSTHISQGKNGAVFCGRKPEANDYSCRLHTGHLVSRGMCQICKDALAASGVSVG